MSEIFNFDLPKELIAQYPLKEREKARLMIVHRENKEIKEDLFENIGNYLNDRFVIVLNDTRVIPARIICNKETGGKIEVFLLKNLDKFLWQVLIKGKIKVSAKFKKEDMEGKIVEKKENGSYIVEFNKDKEEIKNYGEIPLPPYIKRKPEKEDKIYYQTVYAKKNGSIAAPTAGLHFTEEIIEKLKNKGIEFISITLHIGWYSIKVLKENKNSVGEEYLEINEETAIRLNELKSKGKKIIAVGTSTTRGLESATENGKIKPYNGYTNLFIKPGFKFKFIDGLITNFHLPKSTHLSLVCAFAGTELIEKCYKIAIEKKYRFYSYGDSMLII
ncbi:MAG TPA: tRNA preQ1(34) S-adenosylmethionine ribosyltransferase-isomerase QueA [bacterium]|nr:tRNA preQ1(34) S-adenosylmethionine ribosyltransferase-isomerase QueA [bacterium]HOM26168.1 tRNA preQ1(34) S-adenosylmethionine ribosyltransferase-isomerase QueA [bacterium]